MDERGCLLGNSYPPFLLAYLFGELFLELGWVEEGVNLEELVHRTVRLRPKPGACCCASEAAAWAGAKSSLGLRDMARYLLLHQSARGGEIRNLAAVPRRGSSWHEVPTQWFRWKTVVSIPWHCDDSHINVCEDRARDLSIRFRARRAELHGQRYLHFMDSQVNLAVAAKGRSGSRRLSHVQRRSSAALLAANLRDVNAFTASKSNPADKGSRDFKGWARARRRLGIVNKVKKAHESAFSRRQPSSRQLQAAAPPGDTAILDRARPAQW
jgi:hypothetical protein